MSQDGSVVGRGWSVFVIVGAGLVIGPGSAVTFAQSITNPDFEANGGNFTVAFGWNSFGGQKWEGVWTSDRSWTQGVTDIGANSQCGVYQPVSVTSGTIYRVAVYGKTNTTDYDVSIGVAPSGSTNPSAATFGGTSNSGSWTQVTHEFTATGSTATVFLRTRNTKSWAYAGDWGYFDGVTIEIIGYDNRDPEAVADADPTSGDAPLEVAFDGTGSSDPDPGDVLTYDWAFDDGTAHGSGAAPTHTFNNPGTYHVVLTVDDGNGGSDTDGVTIYVTDPNNQPPTAVAAADPTTGDAPLTVTFDASGSSDPNPGDVLTYTWDFDDGSPAAAGETVQHTFSEGGTYNVTLTADDGRGGIDTDTVQIRATGDGNPVGPNLLANPSFETGWSGGLAGDWQSWQTGGSGYVKQSSRLGRIGVGVYYNNSNPTYAAIQLQPKTILLMDDMLGAAGYLRSQLPDALIIGRKWIDNRFNQYIGDPEYYGAVFADEIAVAAAQNPDIDAWQGFNEPYLNDVSTARKVGRFEKAFAERLHQHGIKACVLNIAVGNPGDMNNMLLQEIVDCLTVGDYVGYHAYGGEQDQLMVGPEAPWYANRWRFYIDMYESRGYRMPPVVYTECTTFYAWKGVFTAEQIRDDLMAFEAQSKYVDPWQVGMCIYLAGSNAGWLGWEIANEPTIYNGCGAYNVDHPADAWDGLYSQQFGQNGTSGYTGGVVQAAPVAAGKTYRLEAALKYETYGVGGNVAFRMGLDPTGQASDANAASIQWSVDLVEQGALETDWWYERSIDRLATGSTMSVWFQAAQATGKPAFRMMVDAAKLRELDLPIQGTQADFDGDGDVDLSDYGTFLACYNGPANPPAVSGCDATDFDDDGDVDLSDYGTFLGCYNGPNNPPACP
jgi:PKD repeat protein